MRGTESDIGVICGTVPAVAGLSKEREAPAETPYGASSTTPTLARAEGERFWLLERHGAGHALPPHEVPYRANLYALHTLGVKRVLSLTSVGGITRRTGAVVVPNDLIDLAPFRERHFPSKTPRHAEMKEPFCPTLRRALLAETGVTDGGIYVQTHGPRLETAAEIRMMRGFGGDVVGMTAGTEAALARELGLCYATLSVVVNATDEPVSVSEAFARAESASKGAWGALLGAMRSARASECRRCTSPSPSPIAPDFENREIDRD